MILCKESVNFMRKTICRWGYFWVLWRKGYGTKHFHTKNNRYNTSRYPYHRCCFASDRCDTGHEWSRDGILGTLRDCRFFLTSMDYTTRIWDYPLSDTRLRPGLSPTFRLKTRQRTRNKKRLQRKNRNHEPGSQCCLENINHIALVHSDEFHF